jgi:hypothetical protein
MDVDDLALGVVEAWRAVRDRPQKAKVPLPVIKSKYRRVWVIGRTRARDSADQKQAYDLMKRYRLLELSGREFKLAANWSFSIT